MIALGNLHVGDRVLVKFIVAALPIDPTDSEAQAPRVTRYVWKERKVLGVDPSTRTVRVLGFHLDPADVPVGWLREVPA
jgi:hypothetical protein